MENVAQALNELKDIHPPSSVFYWPLAPGWWLLLILILSAFFMFWYWQKNKKPPYKKHALKELNSLQMAFDKNGDKKLFIQSLSMLIRRVALVVYGPHQVSRLTGKHWLEFLDRTGCTDAFTVGPGKRLIDGPYQGAPEIEVDSLLLITRHWLGSIK